MPGLTTLFMPLSRLLPVSFFLLRRERHRRRTRAVRELVISEPPHQQRAAAHQLQIVAARDPLDSASG